MNLFVTGTDTEIGKTLASCALLHAHAGKGRRVAGMKPVAAGVGADGVNEDVAQLRAASTVDAPYDLVNPFLFREPLAPHIAAQREGATINMARIVAAYQALCALADVVIVEGVGGFRVPLGERWDSADLAARLGLPVVLVVGLRLGCLNHALLTAESVRAAGLRLAGWIANAIDPGMAAPGENVAALAERLSAPLLGRFPHSPRAEAGALARLVDVAPLVN